MPKSIMIDITGQRFGYLIAVAPAGKLGDRLAWLCKCDCGAVTIVIGKSLRNGNTKSCGCWRKKDIGERRRKHGCSHNGTPEYLVWKTMLSRCHNPNRKCYKNYGARGIQVCKRWHLFENFLADMGRRPGRKREYSIERIDNNGNYEPSNCRWLSLSEQQYNQRRNRLLTYKGETHCVAEWSKRLGLNYGTIYWRLRRGLPVEQVLRV